jgi:hypothetical protein
MTNYQMAFEMMMKRRDLLPTAAAATATAIRGDGAT